MENIVLSTLGVLRFINITAALFFLVFFVLRVIIGRMIGSELKTSDVMRFLTVVTSVCVVLVTSFLLAKGHSIRMNYLQLPFSLLLLIPSRCVVLLGLQNSSVILLVVVMIASALLVTITNVAMMGLM